VETRTEAPPRTGPADGRGAGAGAAPPSEPAKKARKAPPIWVLLIGGIVVLALLIFGVQWLAYALSHQSTDDAKVDGNTVAITSKISERVAKVLVDTNQEVRRGQVLILLDDQDERTRLAQAVAARNATAAQATAAQQNVSLTIAQQNAQNQQGTGGITSADAQLKNAQAQYSAAQQQANAARAAIAQAQAQLKQAAAQVPSARQTLVKANADLARTASLVRTGDEPESQLDSDRAAQASAQANYQASLDNENAAETAVTQAQARYVASLASANAAQAGIGAQEGQITTAQGHLSESDTPYRVSSERAQAAAANAQTRSLDAQMRTAQDQLSYTVIRSPIDGYVGEKNIEIGATVAPGQSLLDLIPETGLYITANYKETQLGSIKVGAPVDIEVDAYKGVKFHGHVESIAPASQNTFSLVPAQNATGNFVKVTQRIPIRVIVDDPPADKPLRVGMSVTTAVANQK